MEATQQVPTVGASVCSADGQEFGRVKEVRGGYFEVDTPRMADFWLSCSYIDQRKGEGGAVHLSLALDDVDSHSLRAPDDSQASNPEFDEAMEALAGVSEAGHDETALVKAAIF